MSIDSPAILIVTGVMLVAAPWEKQVRPVAVRLVGFDAGTADFANQQAAGGLAGIRR